MEGKTITTTIKFVTLGECQVASGAGWGDGPLDQARYRQDEPCRPLLHLDIDEEGGGAVEKVGRRARGREIPRRELLPGHVGILRSSRGRQRGGCGPPGCHQGQRPGLRRSGEEEAVSGPDRNREGREGGKAKRGICKPKRWKNQFTIETFKHHYCF